MSEYTVVHRSRSDQEVGRRKVTEEVVVIWNQSDSVSGFHFFSFPFLFIVRDKSRDRDIWV